MFNVIKFNLIGDLCSLHDKETGPQLVRLAPRPNYVNILEWQRTEKLQ